MEIYKSDYSFFSTKISIVAAEFNSQITVNLVEGAKSVLLDRGLKESDISIYWVPGAFELPLTCKKVLDKGNIDGIVAIGAVIKGETPHFDYVAGECAKGILNVSLQANKPVIFGVLTTDTIDQAMNRAGLKYGNKGAEAAHSLLNLLNLYKKANI